MTSAVEKGAIPVPLASRLVRVPPARIRAWLGGYARSTEPPVIRRQLEPVGGRWALGFLDLMEVRFIDYFLHRGLPLRLVRRVVEELRRETNHDHPFALAKRRFRVGMGRIFSDAAEADGDHRLIDLANRQYALIDIVDDLLDDGVTFDEDGVAKRWQPEPKEAPHVIIDPMCSFGRPVIAEAWVPTETLLRAFRAEKNERVVADDFGVLPEIVREAVKFELALAA